MNLRDDRSYALWKKLEPYARDFPKAQIGFTFDHRIIMDDAVSQFFQTVTASLDRMNLQETISSKVMSMVIKLVYAAKMDFTDPILLMTWITDVLMTLGVAGLVKDAVIARVKDLLAAPHAQSDDTRYLFKPLVTLFSAVFFDKIPNSDILAKLVKYGNISRGVLSIWQLLDRIFTKAFPGLYELYVGHPYEVEKLDNCLSNMKEWYKEVQHWVSLDHDTEISRDPETCRQVERLYKQGLRYCVQANELRLDPKMTSALHTHFGVMKRVFDKVERSGALAGGPRMEPLVIQLYGKSGVGKTHMMTPLAIELLKVKGIKDPSKWNQEIYNRMPEQEFWDNYFGQRICIYDDFGQQADSENNPDVEYFELIRTGNIASYALHMANLLEKNKTFFTSEVVILTTNVKRLDPKSICFPEAVRRRIDIGVEVMLKSEFVDVTGRMDKEKVGPEFRNDIYKFQFIDPMTGKKIVGAKTLDYVEFVKLCTKRYKEKIAHSEKVLSHYEALARAPAVAQNRELTFDETMRNRIELMTHD